MSSPSPCQKIHTLTTLPLSILTRILTYLCPHHPFDRTNRLEAPYWIPFGDPRVAISLRCAPTLTVQLPSELLPPALASPVLAAAVANILGHRVSYLTQHNTGANLSSWIKAFSPYVKAVSMEELFPDSFLSELMDKGDQHRVTSFEPQLEHSIHLIHTLSMDQVMLEVLDLQDVHFLDFRNVKDDLMAGLCATLERNSGTLKELALPVFRTSDICDKALEMSHLKKLDVLSVKIWPTYATNHSEALPSPVLRMMRAVDGHADRSRKLTTLRELSFLNVDSLGYYSLTPSDRNSSVFLTIKTLRILMRPDADISTDNDHFISLFENLDRLFWNLDPPSSDLPFELLCTKVPEVHLCDSRWMTASIRVGAAEYFYNECSFFSERSYGGQYGSGALRTVQVGAISGTDVRNVMIYCPRLENISAHITRDNIRAIRKLVAKCQQMKCLELVVDERTNGRLEAEDWRAISRVIPKSHKNLCQVALQTDGRNERTTTAIEAVFGCLERVTKVLGDRARRLAFRAMFRTRQGGKIMKRVCDLLNVCIQHTPALESLEIEIKPYILQRDVSSYTWEWEKEVVRRLIHVENRLLCEVQSLRILDVGVLPSLSRQISWNDGQESH